MKALIASHTDNVFLKPGEVVVTREPALITTVLGSCIAVTMFSPAAGTGAICHAMLPGGSGQSNDLRYVETAVAYIYRMMIVSGIPDDLVVKLFGGAAVLETGAPESRKTIGDENISSAENVLAMFNLSVAARDVGGNRGRRLYFCTRGGDVFLRKVKKSVTGRR